MKNNLSDLKTTLHADMKTALKKRNTISLNTLRLVLSEIQNAEIAKQSHLDDSEIEAILRREIKKRVEARDYSVKGHRPDLVEIADQEISCLASYLPQPLTNREIETVIESILDQWEGEPVFGQVMKRVMSDVGGRADGKAVSELVRRTLERRR